MRDKLILPLLLLGLLVWGAGCQRDHTHTGQEEDHAAPHDNHDHGGGGSDHAHGDEEGSEPVVVTAFTDKLLMFTEYPRLVKGEPAEFLAHFTVLATGEPVRSGTFVLEATGPSNTPEVVKLDAPARDGLFRPQLTLTAPGQYRGRMIINSPQVQDTVELGEMVVYASAAEAAAAPAAGGDDPPDAFSFLLEQQWKIGTRLAQVEARTLTRRLQVPGEIVPQHHAAAIVSAPVTGRLLPPPGVERTKVPVVGDRVKAGQVLAMIEPPLPATEAAALSANRAQLQALETELVIRQLDLETKGLDVQRTLGQAEARAEFAQREFVRAQELKTKGVGSDQQFDQAQQDLRLAEAELKSAQAMQQQYEHAAARLAELRRRMEAQGVITNGAGSASTLQLPLISPISGTIARHESVEGEHVNALEEVYYIVNLEQVWVRASISEFDLAELPATPHAHLKLPALAGREFDVLGLGGRLVNIGTQVDPQTRTVPLLYELPNPDQALRAGLFADVHVETQRRADAVAVPETAIVLDNGRPVVFVMLGGETFQRREVEVGIRDGAWVEIRAVGKTGAVPLKAGEWVVTHGAYALKLASAAPASFGHGHVH